MPVPPKRQPLNERERQFCFYFVRAASARDAVFMAGYNIKNPRNADRQAQRLMKRQAVLDEINRLRSERSQRLDISLDDILVRISALASAAQAKGDLRTALQALVELKDHLTEVSLRTTNKEEEVAAPAQDEKRVAEEAADNVLSLRRSHESAKAKRDLQ